MPSASSELEGPDKHDEYWFENGDLVLLVDEVYFKVHRDLLGRTSGLIKDMLAMPDGENQSRVEGTTLDNAIIIPDVAYQHFEAIMQAAYGSFSPPDLRPVEMTISEEYNDPLGPAVQLVRAAHRLQAPSVLVPVAEAALVRLEPVERFVLCRDLGLDEIRSTYETEQRAEKLRVLGAINARNKRRGVPHRAVGDAELEPLETNFKLWLMEAFTALVLDLTIKMPSSELGDKMSLHIMIAREHLAQLRVSTFKKWANSARCSWNLADVICASEIGKLDRNTVERGYDSTGNNFAQSQWSTQRIVSASLPSREEEEAVIERYWESAGL